ncbi:MAG: hypothetical protein LBQ49_03005, partial [Rickettsiales bacterium]|nr:hypothetical protein [Rickettsiales bacterium]
MKNEERFLSRLKIPFFGIGIVSHVIVALLIVHLFIAPAFGGMPTFGSYFFRSDAVGKAIQKYIQIPYGLSVAYRAAAVYDENVDENGRISVAGIYKVCRVAGWDVSKDEGFGKCREFAAALINSPVTEWTVNAPMSCSFDNAGWFKCFAPRQDVCLKIYRYYYDFPCDG